MRKFRSKFSLLVLTSLVFSMPSCKKPEGPGGRATISGKVWARDFDNTQRYAISSGPAVGERVYIMYGDDKVIGNDVRTGPDGTFEFRFLNKGKYRVFVNSLDTTINFKGNKTFIPVIQDATISGSSETVTLPDFRINK